MDLNSLLTSWNKVLTHDHLMIESHFDINEIKFDNEGVEWKHLHADYVIFCDGINSMKNPYFKALPFAPNKGEALIVSIPGLPHQHIYKNAVSIVPWKNDLFWVGSNYEWQYENENPSPAFREKMTDALQSFLQIPFEVVDHITGIRPANTERRPFVGMHPAYPSLGICNGMGTKGCSLAPYFTHQLMEHLEKGVAIHPEADIHRFVSLLQD
jgi:glycine/D-amino acid oxidase-like deaminating enzyme